MSRNYNSLHQGALLRIWREACRHIEIHESTANILATLTEHLPLERIVVRRLDLAHSALETVASATIGARPSRAAARSELTPAQLQELLAWGGTRQVAQRSMRAGRPLFNAIWPAVAGHECSAVALHGPDGISGVLILAATRGAAFDDPHAALIAALAEPFSAALENDRRLHELKTLREAADAERRSLLTRLGRNDLAAPIVGSGAGLRAVLERVEVVCRSDVPVLLLGETGTGKEVIARAIHDRSARHDKPFIRVNCGAIPSELIDSQLFGHERGSFTGATDTHQGWFERADSGTLFLDEIGELPPAAQVRLLRVLQDGFIERVGGRHSVHVDVRIVAATHRDLAAMVRDGRFRQDLWYRVAVFPIPIPPLRERTQDVPALACHFAEKAAHRFGLPLVMPTPDDMRLLAVYAWPGNVRELGAVIDRAALLGNGRRLDIATALGTSLHPAPPPPAVAPPHTVRSGSYDNDSHETEHHGTGRYDKGSHDSGDQDAVTPAPAAAETLDAAMRAHIESALRACFGRIEGRFGAALRLQVNPHTLRARMRRLGIRWQDFRRS